MFYDLSGTSPDMPFPDPSLAETEPDGLLAMGGDLHTRRLLAAYRAGIFPWFSEEQPILWWSPDPRTVLLPSQLHISRSLRRHMRQTDLRITFNTAFEQVIQACSAPREDHTGTWLTPEMVQAYIRLHAEGFGHSVEVWEDSRLVGGLYGVALGQVFFGESMFSRQSNASKVALVALCRTMTRHGLELLDCQVFSAHLASLGAVMMPRQDFLHSLARLIPAATDSAWKPDPVSLHSSELVAA